MNESAMNEKPTSIEEESVNMRAKKWEEDEWSVTKNYVTVVYTCICMHAQKTSLPLPHSEKNDMCEETREGTDRK
eukprot:m.373523 g.373523  ORF g.373523 m.373523 type:complete len:75 (-) comp68360_c0_seq1:57-281(-)